jgi:hypothetical protein
MEHSYTLGLVGAFRHSKCDGTRSLLPVRYEPGILGRRAQLCGPTLWTRIRLQRYRSPWSGCNRFHSRGHGYWTRTGAARYLLLGQLSATRLVQETEVRSASRSNTRTRRARSEIHLSIRQLRQKLFRRMGEDATHQVHTLPTDDRLPRMQLQTIAEGPVQRAL